MKATIVLLLLTCAGSAFAFDGKRTGFLLSLGGGTGFFRSHEDYYAEYKENGPTLSSDIKIGFGSSSKVQIYWTSKPNWPLDRGTKFIGTAGLGARYFLRGVAPSAFFGGMLGYKQTVVGESFRYSNEDESKTNFGWSVSTGYEFVKGWELEGSGFVGTYRSMLFCVTMNHVWQ